jgi:hypothetical protein
MTGPGETLGSPRPPHVIRPCRNHVMQTICVTVGAMGALHVALFVGDMANQSPSLPQAPNKVRGGQLNQNILWVASPDPVLGSLD